MRYNYNYRNEKGGYAPKVLLVDGCEVHGASAAMYAAQGYHPYTPPEPTAEDTAERDRLARIDELHSLLAESDYKAIKYAEGWITAEDYAAVKAQRQQWRDEINALENF